MKLDIDKVLPSVWLHEFKLWRTWLWEKVLKSLGIIYYILFLNGHTYFWHTHTKIRNDSFISSIFFRCKPLSNLTFTFHNKKFSDNRSSSSMSTTSARLPVLSWVDSLMMKAPGETVEEWEVLSHHTFSEKPCQNIKFIPNNKLTYSTQATFRKMKNWRKHMKNCSKKIIKFWNSLGSKVYYL